MKKKAELKLIESLKEDKEAITQIIQAYRDGNLERVVEAIKSVLNTLAEDEKILIRGLYQSSKIG
ncbi:MAG: hypothetical protein VSS75_013985, partial [Candidatus Parabeggiatoa sp.]|nr:hypothetical protein [Candidatus Parabeggiatoa sp.]